MKRHPVQGAGDMEDRRHPSPRLLDYLPGHNPSMLAQWIMHMLAQQQGAGIQYFNPNTPLGQLQESFGVEAPWLSPFPSNNRLE